MKNGTDGQRATDDGRVRTDLDQALAEAQDLVVGAQIRLTHAADYFRQCGENADFGEASAAYGELGRVWQRMRSLRVRLQAVQNGERRRVPTGCGTQAGPVGPAPVDEGGRRRTER